MVVRVLDVTSRCYTFDDGLPVADAIRSELSGGTDAKVSFTGVEGVPSSFVEGALVSLLDDYPLVYLREHLKITHVRPQVADMIRRCMRAEAKEPA